MKYKVVICYIDDTDKVVENDHDPFEIDNSCDKAIASITFYLYGVEVGSVYNR